MRKMLTPAELIIIRVLRRHLAVKKTTETVIATFTKPALKIANLYYVRKNNGSKA